MDVFLHADFVFGDQNSASITDLPFFSDTEIDTLFDFMSTIYNGGNACGTNKKSSDTPLILQKNHAIQYNIWHYHINHTQTCQIENCTLNIKCRNIIAEKRNFECAEIIHYMIDVAKNHIVIFAYSKKHTKGDFPILYKDPLWKRAKFKKNIIAYEHWDDFCQYCVDNNYSLSLEEYNKFIKSL